MIDPLISSFAQRLYPAYTDDLSHAMQIALWLCEKATGIPASHLIIDAERSMSIAARQDVAEWIEQIVVENKPLQYILGSVPFCGLTISVEPPLLIPRPETEEWVEKLITELKLYSAQPLKILDLCTGTGCVALALAKAFPHAAVMGTDIHPQAVACAQKNAQENGITNALFIESDLYRAVTGEQYDCIVANPPYISEADWQNLEPRVRDWEDRTALVASEDGLALIQKIIDTAPQFLLQHSPIRRLVIEIGSDQGKRAMDYATDRGASVILGYDAQKRPRTLTCLWL